MASWPIEFDLSSNLVKTWGLDPMVFPTSEVKPIKVFVSFDYILNQRKEVVHVCILPLKLLKVPLHDFSKVVLFDHKEKLLQHGAAFRISDAVEDLPTLLSVNNVL